MTCGAIVDAITLVVGIFIFAYLLAPLATRRGTQAELETGTDDEGIG
jgi:hypothetical protein